MEPAIHPSVSFLLFASSGRCDLRAEPRSRTNGLAASTRMSRSAQITSCLCPDGLISSKGFPFALSTLSCLNVGCCQASLIRGRGGEEARGREIGPLIWSHLACKSYSKLARNSDGRRSPPPSLWPLNRGSETRNRLASWLAQRTRFQMVNFEASR